MSKLTLGRSIFYLHRWLGLIVGLLFCIAGLTGSVLVFWHEIDAWILAQRFEPILSTGERVSIDKVIEMIRATYIPNGFTLSSMNFPALAHQPYVVWLEDAAAHYLEVLVNPYTAEVMGDRPWETSWIGRIYALHYSLLAGAVGSFIMGLVALVALILSLTGIVLWPGWRKLKAGFTIKWQAHPKRTNYEATDATGAEIHLNQPAQRIVCLTAPGTANLCTLGSSALSTTGQQCQVEPPESGANRSSV